MTALLPAGVGLAGSLFNAIARPGQTRMREADFDADPEGLARGAYDRMSDPGYGLPQFERLAARAGGTGGAALSRLVAQRGGSVRQGVALAEDGRREASAGAFDAFSQFRTQSDQTALGALRMDQENRMGVRQGMAQQRFQNAGASAGFTNQILGGLAFVYGNRYGAGGSGGMRPPVNFGQG